MSAEAEFTSFVLQILKETVLGFIDLKAGAREELSNLDRELLVLEAFLKEAEKTPEKNDVFIANVKQVRELVYTVEDTIETCATKKAAAKKKNVIIRYVKKLSISMEHEVKTLRGKSVTPMVEKINAGNLGLKVTGDASSSEMKKNQFTGQPSVTGHINTSVEIQTELDEPSKVNNVVDFEDQEIIIKYLNETKEQLDVIAITGMPGAGKTTLAKRIFNNPDVAQKFPLRIWIHVSQEFSREAVFLKILEKLATEFESNPSMEQVIKTVRGALECSTFLLILDDVWDTKHWNDIKEILPMDSKMGKVLVTSRVKNVSGATNINRIQHVLEPLDERKSRELLEFKIYEKLQECPARLRDIVKEIAGKCGGSPLIIGVIGGIMKLQMVETPSPFALESKWSELSSRVGDNLMKDPEESILKAVKLSYRKILSDEAKLCFLYTGLFPDNHEISTSTLMELWIAEGFIRPNGRQSFEATADEILRHLINMNLLMVEKKILDDFKSCRVHDVIRTFCKSKAEDLNLFTVVQGSEAGAMEPSLPELQKTRRLSLHSDVSNNLSKANEAPRVRSILCFFNLDPICISTIPRAFNLLRVLNYKSIKAESFSSFSKLILLKHITLSIKDLKFVPEEIARLLNLQTLRVETKSSSITVKANIWKMTQLQLLETKAWKMMQLKHPETEAWKITQEPKATIIFDDKKWKGEAREKLETISSLAPESCTADLSNWASNLKTMGIRGELDNLSETFSLQSFHQLKKLKLVNTMENPIPKDELVSRGFPDNLETLTLSMTYLEWEKHMPILAKIKTLKVLKLKDNAFSGLLWDATKGCDFPKLQLLLIKNSELVIWKASITTFKSLRWLMLDTCGKLKAIPSELSENLEKIDITHVKTSVTVSAREIKSSKLRRAEAGKIKAGVPLVIKEGSKCNL